MGEHDEPARLVRHIHAIVSADLADRVGHIAIAQRTTRSALVVEALGLLARYYDIGQGLPAPAPPLNPERASTDEATSRRRSVAAQAPKAATTTASVHTPSTFKDVAPVPAAVAVVADVDAYLDPNSVMRDAGMTEGDDR